jgi:hypothetical protein
MSSPPCNFTLLYKSVSALKDNSKGQNMILRISRHQSALMTVERILTALWFSLLLTQMLSVVNAIAPVRIHFSQGLF